MHCIIERERERQFKPTAGHYTKSVKWSQWKQIKKGKKGVAWVYKYLFFFLSGYRCIPLYIDREMKVCVGGCSDYVLFWSTPQPKGRQQENPYSVYPS